MPVECVLSNLESDVRCTVCGQGFLLFADRLFQQHRERVREWIQGVLRRQHDDGDHPVHRFAVSPPPDLLQTMQSPCLV